MSYFKSMFRSVPGRVRTYLIQINRHGETVAWALDEAGQIGEMACGPAHEVIGQAIVEADQNRFVGCIPDAMRNTSRPPWTWGFDYRFDLWKGLADVLNHGSPTWRLRSLAVWRALNKVEAPIYKYITWKHKDGFMITDLAIASDLAYLKKS